ncbi:MAG: branched-chain amino acid ABC transporter permease [bacterium]|nr:branched-chain amino acid ABC transporter permease [bacterium]MCY3924900.1 branched-chain amino acid ABC transporter permease [bacterium]
MRGLLRRLLPSPDPTRPARPGGASANPLLPSAGAKIMAAAGAAGVAVCPLVLDDPFWITVLANAGTFAVAALGLSLLTGFCGQVSLGHAAFLTVGGYLAAFFGAGWGWPLPAWLAAAAAAGAVIGALVGPFALRLRGNYLVVVTLALIFVVTHVARNWEGFTGGFDGISTNKAPLALGGLDFADMSAFGQRLSREQGLFYLSWILVGISALGVRNLVRTRPGRAMQAIRDRDSAAEVIGVSNARYKIAAFAVSAAMASAAGAVYAVGLRFITPNEPLAELFLSIRFVAIIIVGGMGTVYGAILGALLLGPLPELVKEFVSYLDVTLPGLGRPLVSEVAAAEPLFSTAAFSELLFGLLLVLALLFQPQGIAGAVRSLRVRWAGRASRRPGAG